MALGLRALGIELQEIDGELFGRRPRAGFGAVPVGAAHFGELDGVILARADVFRHHIELRSGDIETVRPRVADLDIILHRPVHGHLHDAGEAADAVHVVHDEIADREIGIGLDGLAVGALFRLCAPHAADAGHLRVREDGELRVRVFQTRGEASDRDEAPARRGERLGLFLHIGGHGVIL